MIFTRFHMGFLNPISVAYEFRSLAAWALPYGTLSSQPNQASNPHESPMAD